MTQIMLASPASAPAPMPTLEPMSRAAQRQLHQMRIENEQRHEEMEALQMTADQCSLLFSWATSVNFEVDDLDGLKWRMSRMAALEAAERQKQKQWQDYHIYQPYVDQNGYFPGLASSQQPSVFTTSSSHKQKPTRSVRYDPYPFPTVKGRRSTDMLSNHATSGSHLSSSNGKSQLNDTTKSLDFLSDCDATCETPRRHSFPTGHQLGSVLSQILNTGNNREYERQQTKGGDAKSKSELSTAKVRGWEAPPASASAPTLRVNGGVPAHVWNVQKPLVYGWDNGRDESDFATPCPSPRLG